MNCAICYGRDMAPVLDLGEMALAGAFLKPEQFGAERFYPLRVGFCRTCFSVQVQDRVSPAELYTNYFYRSSTSKEARKHFARYAGELIGRFSPRTAVEIGCNDGAMLKPLAERVERVIGVDPSAAAAELDVGGAHIWRSFFGERSARVLPKADIVIANNVFAHVEDIHDFTRGVRTLLAPDGVFVFECHYLGAVLAGQYDAIYHEHVFYHSLIALQNHFRFWGMQVFDVKPVERHGGSMRFYVCKQGTRVIEPAVEALSKVEIARGFHREEAYKPFSASVFDHRRSLFELLSRLSREGAKVAAYGAAGRANTLLQWCGVNSLEYVVDDCPAKHGHYTPGTHFEIRPPAALEVDRPDYVLVTAWTYLDEIRPKCGGLPLIVPFPKAEVLTGEALEAAA